MAKHGIVMFCKDMQRGMMPLFENARLGKGALQLGKCGFPLACGVGVGYGMARPVRSPSPAFTQNTHYGYHKGVAFRFR